MKKLLARFTLAAVLATGLLMAVNTDAVDLSWGEREPPVVKPTDDNTTS